MAVQPLLTRPGRAPLRPSRLASRRLTRPGRAGVIAKHYSQRYCVTCNGSDDDLLSGRRPRAGRLLPGQRSPGCKAIIGIYSTALGPALGGTRFYPYATEDAALPDVLDLSRGMAYKNALAGLDLGGGKAVIMGDPRTDKSEALLRAYGRFVESLGGRYFTACDVGTYVEDMDVVARETRYVTGRSAAHGGAGDSSVLTACGVFQGMRAAAEHVWGAPTLSGRHVGIAGLGKVGRHLTAHLLEDGAEVVVTDVDPGAVERLRASHPQVDGRATPTSWSPPTSTCTRPARSAARSTTRPCRRCAPQVVVRRGQQPARPRRASAEAAARPRHPLRPRLPGQRRRRDPGRRTRSTASTSSGPSAQGSADLRHRPGRSSRLADDEGVPPAVAADRLAEQRISEAASRRSVLVA